MKKMNPAVRKYDHSVKIGLSMTRPLIFLLLLISLQGIAQDVRVTGRITDSTGNGVSGASVTIKGGSTGVATDATGNFAITAARMLPSLFLH